MTKSIVLKGNGKPTIMVTRSSEGSEESSLFEDAFLNQGFKLGKTSTDADIHSNSYLAKPSPQTKEAGSLLLKEASLPTTSRLSQLEARTSWTASGEPSTTLARDDEGEER